MQLLECHVKEYPWGKFGSDSLVARLYAAGHKKFSLGNKTPYAEMWMGTHPDGPARVRGSSERLSSFIARSHSAGYLSNNNHREDIHLPFIMKVMSIRTTLSLQVHPTKEQAVRLHKRNPIQYPDEHHKPELAYALTRFELLCGFRPAKEIIANMEAFPSLRKLFGEKNCDVLRNLINSGFDQRSLKCRIALATCFKNMMNVEGDLLKSLLYDMLTSLDKGVRGILEETTVGVIRKMSSDFPGDVGIFSPLFLNHMILQPGECCYYAAEELHAYLSGECVECVGCSNNTIRAAMTSKYIDREALCEVLNYQMTNPVEYLVPCKSLPEYPGVDEYAPDCKDFQLHRIRFGVDGSQFRLPVLKCASIMVMLTGCGTLAQLDEHTHQEVERMSVSRGDVIYFPPGRRLQFVEATENIEAYRTFSYEMGPDHSKRQVVRKVLPSVESYYHRPEKIPYTPVFNVEAEMDGML